MSLARRVVLAATVLLVVLFAVLGWILDAAMRDAVETQIRQRLEAHIYTLLATVELLPDGGMEIPADLPEPRLMQPDSGLYATVTGEQLAWRSPSSLGENPNLPAQPIEPGAFVFLPNADIGPERALVLRYAILWVDRLGGEHPYWFSVAENRELMEVQIGAFRRQLWGWAGAALLVFIALQIGVLRWGLAPLRRLRNEVSAVREGHEDQIRGVYPSELAQLKSGLNAFIASERKNLQRQRNQLGDLAHSLKTPLAVVRSGTLNAELLEQIDSMDRIVAYQLRRARTSGKPTWAQPVAVEPVAEKIATTLEKLYADKQVACEFDVDAAVRFYGDEGDLSELIGNLLENAFKWASSRILLSVSMADGGWVLLVEDDGPGIAPDRRDDVLQRGVRVDERTAGHGIGLAIVTDLVEAYGGSIAIDQSALGGASIRVQFP